MGCFVFRLARESPGLGDVVPVLLDHGLGKLQALVRPFHRLPRGRPHLQLLRTYEELTRGSEKTLLDRLQFGGPVDAVRLARLLARRAGVAVFQRRCGRKENFFGLVPETRRDARCVRADRVGACLERHREFRLRGPARVDGLSEVLGCQPDLLSDVIQRLLPGKEVLRSAVGDRPPLKAPRGEEVCVDLRRSCARVDCVPEDLGADVALCAGVRGCEQDVECKERNQYPAPSRMERRT